MVKTDQVVLCTDILKHATRQAHGATEVLLMPLLKSVHTMDEYNIFLAIFYSFFSAAEREIKKCLPIHWVPDMPQRRKSHLIEEGWRSLGLKKPPILPDVPIQINNPLQALGYLYVLEGSTLGGAVIAKIIRANTCINLPDAALSFFEGYGTRTLHMWEEFKRQLNKLVHTREEMQVVVTAANDAFLMMQYCIKSYS